MPRLFATLVLAGFFLFPSIPTAVAQTLEEKLLAQDSAELAAKAEASGDARLGAIAFHQVYLTCTQCHGINAAGSKLAPDLSKPETGWKPGDVVQAILEPSAKIRKGYESTVVVTSDGTVITGIVDEETAEQLVLRDAARPGQNVTLAKRDRGATSQPKVHHAQGARQSIGIRAVFGSREIPHRDRQGRQNGLAACARSIDVCLATPSGIREQHRSCWYHSGSRRCCEKAGQGDLSPRLRELSWDA
ncbi:MAG: hypothetical protein U1D30_20710 [Planctomycetota bacterium]